MRQFVLALVLLTLCSLFAACDDPKPKPTGSSTAVPISIINNTHQVSVIINQTGFIGGKAHISGKLTSKSNSALIGLYVSVSFEDKEKRFLSYARANVSPKILYQGDTGTFEVYSDEADQRIKRFSYLVFDQSGKQCEVMD